MSEEKKKIKFSSSEKISHSVHLTAERFKHVRSSLKYADIHTIRHEITEYLQIRNVTKVHVDKILLVLSEILSNLIKHPPKKATHVEIRAFALEEKVELEILDNSTPFTDFNVKCNSALSKLNATATEAEQGYGLGCILTLYKNPIYKAAASPHTHLNQFKITQMLHTEKSIMNEVTNKNKKKIFLIDDDSLSLKIHTQMLEDDYEIFIFEKAEEALAAFKSLRPDLVISDMTMPGMDGASLRQALKAIEGGNTTPFIFLSGHSASESNFYINQLGIDDFLCKPVSRQRLHTVITRLLHRSTQIHAAVHGQFNHDVTELLKPSLPKNYNSWNFFTAHAVAEAGGGDFIMHQETTTNMTGVLIDVMGHGRQAKFFSYVYAGYLRSMFRMYAGSLDAAHFLRYLSQSIQGDSLLESMMMTCQCFQFFPEGIFKISSAGHPPPIIFRHDNIIEPLDITGPLPGLLGDISYEMKSVRLQQGERILFMTDGFLEAFDQRGHATHELLKLAQSAPTSSTSTLADYLWGEFQKRQRKQKNHKDDATIIIAEYGGSA